MRLSQRFVTLTAVVVLGLAARANADPVMVTGGTVTLNPNGLLDYSMVTDAAAIFSNSPQPSWSAVGYSIGCAATGCAPGELLTFNNETSGTDVFGNPTGFADLGTATVSTGCCGVHENASVRGHWTFISEGAALPTSGAEFVTVTAPFAFRGSFDLAWCDSDCVDGLGGLFMRRTGGGVAGMSLQLTNDGYVIRPGTALSYTFFADATPEPSSILLLATGVLGLGSRRFTSFGSARR